MVGAIRRAVGATLVVAGMLPAWPALALNHFGLVDTGELFVSANGGTTWTVRSTLPVRDARALAAGATSSELFLVSESGSIYRSTDAGLSWSAISAVPAGDLVALVPAPGRLLLFTRSGGVYASLDGGASFAAVGALTASDLVAATRLGTELLAVTRTGSVYRSGNGGASWSAVGALPASNVVGMATLAADLYVLTATGDVARSSDAGAGWSFVGTLSQSGMSALLGGGSELLASTAAGEVAASVDGAAWTWRGAINQLAVAALASDQPNPTAVGRPEPPVEVAFALRSNPVAGEAQLVFDLSREADVTLIAHDLAGRDVVRVLSGERLPAGRTRRTWRPGDLPSGLYFLGARIGERTVTRRMVWVR